MSHLHPLDIFCTADFVMQDDSNPWPYSVATHIIALLKHFILRTVICEIWNFDFLESPWNYAKFTNSENSSNNPVNNKTKNSIGKTVIEK